MKRLLFICLLLLSGANFAAPAPPPAPQLSWRFANPRIIRLSPSGLDHLQFDVQVQSTLGGYYLWTGTVKLVFNNTTFNNTNTNWRVSTIGAFSGMNSSTSVLKYAITTSITGVAPNKIFNIGLTGDVGVTSNGPNADDFAEIPTTWTTILTVSARLLDTSGDGLAGIDFLESGMNGFEQYIPDASGSNYTGFNSPNLFDARNFLASYTGRFYSTGTNLWSQIGGSSNNAQYSNFATSVSTTVWDGTAAMPSGVANAKALSIDSLATVTIPKDGQVTVTGNTAIANSAGLTINSDATGTGSLITGTTSGLGTSIINRWLTGNVWHLVSSPVVQTITSFLTGNPTNIPSKSALARGMMDYNPSTEAWNGFFTDGTVGSVGSGKGYCLRTSADAAVTFTGALQAGTESITGLTSAHWNSIGNPYSSGIKINSNSDAVNNFITVNSANLDGAYAAVYVWDPTLNTGAGDYVIYNQASSATNLPLGQAFLVKMGGSATSLSFTNAMQTHTNTVAVKAAKNTNWPTIKLTAAINNANNTTTIAYNNDMTKGLDPTYDAGLLKAPISGVMAAANSDVTIYTKLVDDIGIPFAIQALPGNINNLVIPVGIQSLAGGDVVFTAKTFDLPTNVKVILEDRVKNTFTDLSTSSYKTTIAANTDVSNRFFLHNSISTTQGAIGDPTLTGKLNAYAYMNSEIRIEGEVSKDAVATLYDVQGKTVIIRKLSEGSLNVVPTSSVSTGLYLLTVRDGNKSQSFKIILRD